MNKMESKTCKLLSLFLAVGLGSGLVSTLVASLSLTWSWTGLGAILATGLFVSVAVARRFRWLSQDLNVRRCMSAALIVIVAYPISMLVVIAGLIAYESLYAKAFPTEWGQRAYSGDLPYTMAPLYFAAIVAAVLMSLALRVLTRKWLRPLTLLLILGSVLTIPLSQSIAALIGVNNWNLVLFPVGETLFGALSGYWLLRANSVDDQEFWSPVRMSEPRRRRAA